MKYIVLIGMLALFGVFPPHAAILVQSNGIDPEALIERILQVDRRSRLSLQNVSFDTEYVEGEETSDIFVEKERFNKKVLIKYLTDTALYYERFVTYYKDGAEQNEKELTQAAAKRVEDKERRKGKDVSFPILRPFYASHRDLYDITYEGLVENVNDRYLCHHFSVKAKDFDDSLINGNFFFEAESFALARVDFSPVKLIRKTMFKMSKLEMSILYGPTAEGFWLPEQFNITGKGKAAFFIGVNFSGVEYYRNPIINDPVNDSLFFAEGLTNR
ncbi:MAG: hypothetical protein SGI97_09570 [candidate division Zixibacteria bacterium]|nr:hypothetical protein [candidate division Zixibacteria bacterium]